jgi:hypothetical protein
MPVDRPIQVAPAAPDLEVCLVDEPRAAASPGLAMAALPQVAGQDRCKLGLLVPSIDLLRSSIIAEHDAAVKKHLGQVPQGQAVAQAP